MKSTLMLFEKFMEENPWHMSPEDALEAVLEDDFLGVRADDPCLPEARSLLDKWERDNTPLELRRAEADFFFLKWEFVGGNAKIGKC